MFRHKERRMHNTPLPRIILAVTGASGIQYAVRLAQALSGRAELHLMHSRAAIKVQRIETDISLKEMRALAHAHYDQDDIMAGPASGSWQHQGMVVCPCSMATLAAVAGGLGDNLIHRAADVCLKERRKLILVVRETPLSDIHLSNMLTVSRAGGCILPASPGFYHRPRTLQDVIDHLAGRVLDQLGIEHSLYVGWETPPGPDVTTI